MVSAQLALQLPTSEQAPEIARRRVVERFAAELDPVQLEDARLLTSELVTSAVVHGQGAIGLCALLDEDRLMIEVTDEGEGFERTVRQHGLDAVGGTASTSWTCSRVGGESTRAAATSGSSSNVPGPRLGTDAKPKS